MHSCGSIDRRHNRRLQLQEALQNAASLPVDLVPFGRLVDRAQRISVDRVNERLTRARDDEDLVLVVVAYFGERLWQLVVRRTSEREGPSLVWKRSVSTPLDVRCMCRFSYLLK